MVVRGDHESVKERNQGSMVTDRLPDDLVRRISRGGRISGNNAAWKSNGSSPNDLWCSSWEHTDWWLQDDEPVLVPRYDAERLSMLLEWRAKLDPLTQATELRYVDEHIDEQVLLWPG